MAPHDHVGLLGNVVRIIGVMRERVCVPILHSRILGEELNPFAFFFSIVVAHFILTA
jgi:hypothetical protein